MKQITFIAAFLILFSCSAPENENNLIESTTINEVYFEKTNIENNQTNWEKISEKLNIFINNNRNSSSQYYCSEIMGGYSGGTYVTSGIFYLNHYYQEIFGDPNMRNSDIETTLNNRYNTPNAGGTYSEYIEMQFDLYGFNGNVYTNVINTNRILNEVNCLIINEIQNTNNPPMSSKRPDYNINFYLDYLLCCDGYSCCDPFLNASGYIYWD